MRRRDFITLIGGTVTWPFAARARQLDQLRRIGVLMDLAADDPQSSKELTAFRNGLQERGWTIGGNLQIDYRWSAGNIDLKRRYASELVALAPDVVLAAGGTFVGALQQVTRAVPIVFVEVSDPVNRGLVASLARPGGNTTGFTQFEFRTAGKWLELLKHIAPNTRRVAVIRDPSESSGIGYFTAIQAISPSLGVEVSAIDARDTSEIERAIALFARDSNSGMILTPTGEARSHRETIIAAAARLKLPAVYPYRYTSPRVASSPTVPISSTNVDSRLATWIAFSRARSLPTCRCRHPRNISWSSTERPPRHLGSPCHLRCSPLPTR